MSAQTPSFSAHPELPDGVEPAPVPVAAPPSGLAAVPAWVPFVAFFTAVVAGGLVGLFIAGIASLAGADLGDGDSPPALIIGGGVLQAVAFIGTAVLFTRLYVSRIDLAAFGLRTTRPVRAALWVVAVYLGFAMFALVYSQLVGDTPEQDLVNDLRDEGSIVVLAGFAILVALVAPIAEEFFFRGFLYGVLRERIGIVWAVLVAGTLFGLVHVLGTPISALAVLVVLGIGLCLLYERTGSLLPCMALHSINNAIAFSVTVDPAGWVVLLLVVGGPATVVAVGRSLSPSR